jgi:adenine deaminase
MQTVRSAPVSAADLALDADGASRVRVIEIVPEQLITIARELEPSVRDGAVVADPSRDLAKIAVIERHHATGRVGRGLVTGFGLRRGAFASTVAHDAHNLVVVGVDDADMAACAARLAAIGGGIVVARGGEIVAELALPVAGLLSAEPVEEVVARLEECQERLREQGVEAGAPFMTLSFLALSVIPALKITDRGLVDVERFEIVGLGVDG